MKISVFKSPKSWNIEQNTLFVAYKVYKELERIIGTLGMKISVDMVIKIAKTITTIKLRLPLNDDMITRTMILTPEHRSLMPLFDYLGV